MGELAALNDPPAVGEAEGYYGQALSLAQELELRPLQARTHLGLGRVLRLAGDRERAEDHLATALGLLREMDMRFWLSRAAEELLHLGHLFVVARHNIQLYDYLKREYAGEPVTVILDRRHGQRRERAEATASERRPPTGGASSAWTSPSVRAGSRSSRRSSEGPDPARRRLPPEGREAPAHQPHFRRALAVGARLRLEGDALADPGRRPRPSRPRTT